MGAISVPLRCMAQRWCKPLSLPSDTLPGCLHSITNTCFKFDGEPHHWRYVAYHPQIKRIVLAFTGATQQQTNYNVAVDGNFRMKNLDWLAPSEPSAQVFRALKVHAGFNNEYGRFRQDVQARIKQFQNTVPNWYEYEFFFVGFSLGSALATHAALDIQLTVLDPLNSAAPGPVFSAMPMSM